MVLEKTLESSLKSKEIKPVYLKGNQPWIRPQRTDAEVPILWPPDANSWLTGQDPDAGKDWRQEEKGMTKNEMVGWHHRFNGHEPGWISGDGEGSLVCCSLWSLKELNMTWQLNNNKLGLCYNFGLLKTAVYFKPKKVDLTPCKTEIHQIHEHEGNLRNRLIEVRREEKPSILKCTNCIVQKLYFNKAVFSKQKSVRVPTSLSSCVLKL